MRAMLAAFGFVIALASGAVAEAKDICTLVADAETGAVLLDEGDCDARVTPASTFKVALAVIGFESGYLVDAETPVLPFREGDADWGGADWMQDTTPARWMRYSVVWYSQRITHALGAATVAGYLRDFDYGNADLSGDAGFDNGLDRAWLTSSLLISPREQAVFLLGLVNGTLPVSATAMERTRAIVESRPVGGWTVWGKTGSAYPRRADRSLDYARGWGWYVGWAERENRRIVFVRLTQARERTRTSTGVLTRDALLDNWPALMARIGLD